MNDFEATDKKVFDIGHVALIPNLEPQNLAEEKKKFLKKKKYNPQFVYNKINEKHYHGVVEGLSEITVPQTPLGVLLDRRRRELIDTAKAILAIGTENFPRLIQKVYQSPDQKTVAKAMKIHKEHPAHLQFLKDNNLVRTHTFTGEAAAKEFEDRLKHYGLQWTVELHERQVTRVKVRGGSRILIKKDAHFNQDRIVDVMAHEIDVHILRNENAQRQPYFILQAGTANYLPTEEGLATLAKKVVSKFKYLCSSSVYLLTVDLATKYSFRDTYNALLELHVPESRAFDFTVRAKRGLSDTEVPGAFCKDAVYFAGALQVSDFILNGGDVKDLFIGKIGVADVPLLKKSTGIVAPHYLPDFVTNFPAKVRKVLATNF